MGGSIREFVNLTKLFQETHRWLKRWVFCFPHREAGGQPTTPHDMNTPPILHKSAPTLPTPEGEVARELITDLGRIYLEAGLPLAAAFEAALADYQCTYEAETLCPA